MLMIIGIVVYLLIGGLVAGLLEERSEIDELYFFIAWPLFGLLGIIYIVTRPTAKLGRYIAMKLRKRRHHKHGV